jgi:hypothetical protein
MPEDQYGESREHNLETGLESTEGLEKTEGVEQPLGADEIILGSDGQPINRDLAWAIARQRAENGMVPGPDGTLIT